MAVPRILGIHILGGIVTLKLDVGRYRDLSPAVAVIVNGLKSLYTLLIVPGKGKFPLAVQTVLAVSRAVPIKKMIGMGRQPVLLKDLRIFYDLIIKNARFHRIIAPFSFLFILLDICPKIQQRFRSSLSVRLLMRHQTGQRGHQNLSLYTDIRFLYNDDLQRTQKPKEVIS